MMEVFDWNVDADAKNIRPGSIELQRAVHREWHEKIKARPPEQWMKSKPYWRVQVINKLEVRLGRPIFGEVLEIGAGSALCSAFAAKRESVTCVTAMDYDRFCVDEMMPTIFDKFDAPVEKLQRALGSYNLIPYHDHYDFIIGVGALHHAEDLWKAFAAIFEALKPGGIFLVSDVCEPDSTSNRDLEQRYESPDPDGARRYGKEVKLKDNGDHWYRLSEWLTASRSAGFEILPFLFDRDRGEPADDRIFSDPDPWRGFQPRVFEPYFSDRGHCDQLMLIAQKPDKYGKAEVVRIQASDASGTETGPEQGGASTFENAALKAKLENAEAEIVKLHKRAVYLKELLAKANQKLYGAKTG